MGTEGDKNKNKNKNKLYYLLDRSRELDMNDVLVTYIKIRLYSSKYH